MPDPAATPSCRVRQIARELGFKLRGHRLELYAVPLDEDEKP